MLCTITEIVVKRTNDINNLGNVISVRELGVKDVPRTEEEFLDAKSILFTGMPVPELYKEFLKWRKNNREKLEDSDSNADDSISE